MGMILISAMAKKNRVIGNKKGLPWSIPEEYKHFLSKTDGHPVIMGRKTYDILTNGTGQEYEKEPESKMFVVSGSLADKEVRNYKGAKVCNSLEEAIQGAQKLDDKYFCAGGASLYKESIEKNLASEMYLSEIEGDWEGTAYFPEFDKKVWTEMSRETHNDKTRWDFVVYKNTSI